jgi:hypothetical protein
MGEGTMGEREEEEKIGGGGALYAVDYRVGEERNFGQGSGCMRSRDERHRMEIIHTLIHLRFKCDISKIQILV